MKRAVCLMILLGMVLAGCAPADPKAKYVQGVTSTSVTVGTIGPTSGSLAIVGVPMLHGIQAYFNMVNDAGGVNGRKIEILSKDDQFKPDIAVQKGEELVDKDKVFAVVGQLGTPGCLATVDYFKEKGIPCVYQGTGVSKFSQVKANYFPVQPNYTFEGKLLVSYALNTLKAQSVALIYGNDDAGKEGMAGVKAQFADLKKESMLKAEIPFNITDVDFSVHVQKAAAAKADVTIILGYQRAVPAILLEAKKQGFKSQFMTSYINADLTVMGLAQDAANGVICTAWVPDITDTKNAAAQKFVTNYVKYFPKETPNAFAAAGWVAAEVFTEGLKKAGKNLTWTGYIAAMESFKDWSDGLAKGITYTADRRNGVERMYFMKAVIGSTGSRFEVISDFMSVQ